MPTYEYRCGACGHEFEDFASMSAPALKKCPACKKASLERLIGTGAAVLFKGSGFYQTDYRSEGYKKAAEAAKSGVGTGEGGGGGGGGGESKDTTASTKREPKVETKSESSAASKAGVNAGAKAASTPGVKTDAKPGPKSQAGSKG
jgi:putative FmdB family regulatory protein